MEQSFSWRIVDASTATLLAAFPLTGTVCTICWSVDGGFLSGH